MDNQRFTGSVTALAIFLAAAIAIDAPAQAPPAPALPPPPPSTIWNFLGIPQSFNKIRDATANARGFRPQRERIPPLKRIADPANLAVDNPAIQAAAKIKMDADLAPQKIKAIRYLATVCCGCAKNRDEVKQALLAALDDCTEEVRYEAAIALCQCAKCACATCDNRNCCDEKVVAKLTKVAEGQDPNGCWYESSPRVRAAAANALNACRMVPKPAPGPTEAPKPGGEAPTLPPATPPDEGPKPLAPPPGKLAPPAPAKEPAAPTTLIPAPTNGHVSSMGTSIRIVSPANYTEPLQLPAASEPSVHKAQPKWPVALPLLDARWQRPLVPAVVH